MGLSRAIRIPCLRGTVYFLELDGQREIDWIYGRLCEKMSGRAFRVGHQTTEIHPALYQPRYRRITTKTLENYGALICWWEGAGSKQDLTLQIPSQVSPWKSSAHLHEKDSPSLVQVPPFLQGDESHGFGSRSKKLFFTSGKWYMQSSKVSMMQ